MNRTVGRADDVSRAELFDSLCNVRRLHVLDYLSERGPEAELGTLVDHVAAAEYEKVQSAVSRPERRRVYVSLYQTHLPKLEEQGLIEWDRDDNRVRLVARRSVDAVLDSETPEPTPWYRYYLGLSVLSGTLFALVLGGVEPFSAVAPRHYAVGVALAFLALSVAQWASGRPREIGLGDRLIPK